MKLRGCEADDRVKKKIVNAVLFQITWFACVLGGAQGIWLWGAIGVALLLVYSYSQSYLSQDLKFVGVLLVAGLCLDSFWATIGILDFGSEAKRLEFFGNSVLFLGNNVLVAPPWILLLWAGVGLTLMHSLGFFVERPWLGALMAGGASVPSYLAGQRLGAVVLPDPYALGFIVLTWAVLFCILFSWARTLSSTPE